MSQAPTGDDSREFTDVGEWIDYWGAELLGQVDAEVPTKFVDVLDRLTPILDGEGPNVTSKAKECPPPPR